MAKMPTTLILRLSRQKATSMSMVATSPYTRKTTEVKDLKAKTPFISSGATSASTLTMMPSTVNITFSLTEAHYTSMLEATMPSTQTAPSLSTAA